MPVSLDGLRTHIAAARVVHGDDEADRLQGELDWLLALRDRCDRQAPATGTGESPNEIR